MAPLNCFGEHVIVDLAGLLDFALGSWQDWRALDAPDANVSKLIRWDLTCDSMH